MSWTGLGKCRIDECNCDYIAGKINYRLGLSISSITTNIKIGTGGAYFIISKSSGLEAGSLKEMISSIRRGDISIFGLSDDLQFTFLRDVTETTNFSYPFAQDSSKECSIA